MYPLHDANARKLGARYARTDRYPVRRDYYGTRGGDTFGVYYFNASGGEVAYFLPDMIAFHPEGFLHTFNPPRQWGAEALRSLGPKRELV